MMRYLKDYVNICSPSSILHSDESTLWTKSCYDARKKMIKTWVLTNERLIHWTHEKCYIQEEIALQDITDVRVINCNTNNNKYTMNQAGDVGGDVLILHDNSVAFNSLCGLDNPDEVVKLIKSLIHARVQSFER